MEFGQVTILNRMNQTQTTTNAIQLESVVIGGNDRLLVLDSNIKVTDGTTSAMSTLVTAASTSYPIQSIANDGTNVSTSTTDTSTSRSWIYLPLL